MPPKFTYIVKGKYWRFRRGKLNVALPGHPETAGFWTRYNQLVDQSEGKKPEDDESSFAYLIARYRKSAEFGALRPHTQDDYGKTLDLLDRELGSEPFALTTPQMIKAVRDSYAKTPRKAHKVKQMVSRLYTWGAESGMVDMGFNPAAPIKRLKVRQQSIPVWSEYEIDLFRAACPDWLMPAFMLALYTGQRREDVVSMTWDDWQGDFVRLRQSKTGEPLDVACHPALKKFLAARKTGFGGPIVRNANGRPMTANALSQAIRRVVTTTEGMPRNRSLHGLRYAAAGRGDEAGWTHTEAVAILGHRTKEMAEKYMKQRRESEAAMAKIERGNAS